MNADSYRNLKSIGLFSFLYIENYHTIINKTIIVYYVTILW